MNSFNALPKAGELPNITGFIQVKNKFLLENYIEFYVTLNEEEHPYDPNYKFTLYRGVSHEYKDVIYVFETNFYIRAKDIVDFTVYTEYNAKRFELMSTIDDDSKKYRYVNDFVIKENYAKLIYAQRRESESNSSEKDKKQVFEPIQFGDKTINAPVEKEKNVLAKKISVFDVLSGDLIAFNEQVGICDRVTHTYIDDEGNKALEFANQNTHMTFGSGDTMVVYLLERENNDVDTGNRNRDQETVKFPINFCGND